MKRSIIIILILAVFSSTSCIKNDKALWEGSFAEIDAATWNANAVGVTYPILTRIPAPGRLVSTSTTVGDSTLRRLNGSIQVRINLVGAQLPTDQTVGYKIFTSPITVVSFPATVGFGQTLAQAPNRQTPERAGATLTLSDAVAGTHYTALNGKVTIPANSSFGYITIQFLGASANEARFIGIQLDDTGTIKPSFNYSQVGLVIDQR